MVLQAEDHLDAYRDGRRWRDLRRALRVLPEPERLAFILRMMDFHPKLGWALANACLRRRDLVERVFRRSFPIVSASSTQMGVLVRQVVPRLGVRRVVQILFAELDAHPDAVSAALYFLPRHINPRSRREDPAVDRIHAAARARGVLRGPMRVPVPPEL